MQRIPDGSSIFTYEAKAVELALDSIRTCDANNEFIVFSDDSLSVLEAMNHTDSKNPKVQKLLEKNATSCYQIKKSFSVRFLVIQASQGTKW